MASLVPQGAIKLVNSFFVDFLLGGGGVYYRTTVVSWLGRSGWGEEEGEGRGICGTFMKKIVF